MTQAELIRLLKKHGCYKIDKGSRHDFYFSPITGNEVMVGRHAKEEVRAGTLHKILKDAGIELNR